MVWRQTTNQHEAVGTHNYVTQCAVKLCSLNAYKRHARCTNTVPIVILVIEIILVIFTVSFRVIISVIT